MGMMDYSQFAFIFDMDGTLLDLAYDEDSKADVDMNIVETGDGRLIEVQGTAEADPFGRDALLTMLDLAQRGITELVALQREVLGDLVAA